MSSWHTAFRGNAQWVDFITPRRGRNESLRLRETGLGQKQRSRGERVRCGTPGCSTVLRSLNESGHCSIHQGDT